MSMINFLASTGRAFSEWRQRERAYSELMALDDHSLADIGIHRSQISALIAGDPAPGPAAASIAAPKREAFVRRKEA